MFRITLAAAATTVLGCCAVATSVAAPADATGVLYSLITPPSSLEVGCTGPCACPAQVFPTYGSFRLVLTSVDPLYTNYDVTGYIASFNNGPGAVAITGSGHYRIGGEVALVQELTLDLDIEGQPTEHFDSGLVPVSVPFPQIDVSCAVHGFACLDSVLIASAKPVETASAASPLHPAVALAPVRPNPFRQEALVTLTLPRPEPFDLTVVDLAGRGVRSLAQGRWYGTVPQSIAWDGRRDDGRRAPAGVYWVRLRCADGGTERRVVKLD